MNRNKDYFTTMKFLVKLVWQASPLFFSGLIFLTFLTGLIPLVALLISSTLIDSLVRSSQVSQSATLPTTLVILLVLMGISNAVGQFLTGLRSGVESLYQKRVANHVNLLIAEKASLLDLAFFENPEFHNTLANASREASYRPVTIVTQLMTVISTFVSLISVATILLFWHAWIIPLILLSSLALFGVSARFGTARAKLAIKQTSTIRKTQYLSMLLTSDTIAKESRIFGLRHFLLSRYRGLLAEIYQQDSQLIHHQIIYSGAIEVMLSIIRPLLLAFVALQILTHHISIGQFYLYTQSIGQVESGLYSLMFSLAQLHENNLFVANLFRFLALSPDVEAPRMLKEKHKTPLSPPHIEFRHVSFSYPDTTTKVINDLSFHISAGETVALVGENGAGKTTFVKLLTGLYRPTEGQILFDDVDIDTLNREDLRAYLSVIFQDYSIYHFSMQDNIGIGHIEHIDNRNMVELAAQRSRLVPIIDALPAGYETILGRWIERGHELSGGQRQLVALARSLMRQAYILVLDEPTAALDIHNELHFFNHILDNHKNFQQTIIFISHRLSTVRRAHRILVLEKGVLIEQGSHHELMNCKGRYAEMFALQAQMYGDLL